MDHLKATLRQLAYDGMCLSKHKAKMNDQQRENFDLVGDYLKANNTVIKVLDGVRGKDWCVNILKANQNWSETLVRFVLLFAYPNQEFTMTVQLRVLEHFLTSAEKRLNSIRDELPNED